MKKILLAIFVFCLLGCYTICDDCGGEPPEPPSREPFYVNNSGVAVKITFIMETNSSFIDENYYEYTRITKEIKNDWIICNYYNERYCSAANWDVPGGYEGYCSSINCGNLTSFKIEFLSEPKVCLVFDGEDEKENDIRYWKNYILTKENPPIANEYYYYITPELMQQAKEEYCSL